MPDHDALFANLAAVLRPGGRLVAQCGGAGNIASVKRVLATIGDGWLGPAHYETPMATVRRLDAAGFVDIECWLTDEPTRFEPGEPFETFLRTVILGAEPGAAPAGASTTPSSTRSPSRLPEPLIDYVRLNIVARRSGEPLTAVSASADPERGSVARDHDVGGRQDARPAALDRSLVGRRAGRSRASGRRATTGGSWRRRRRRR